MIPNRHPLSLWLHLHRTAVREQWADLLALELAPEDSPSLVAYDEIVDRLVELTHNLDAVYQPCFDLIFVCEAPLDPEELVRILRSLEALFLRRLEAETSLGCNLELWQERLSVAFERVLHSELDACIAARAARERFNGFSVNEDNHEIRRNDLGHEFHRDHTYPWMARS